MRRPPLGRPAGRGAPAAGRRGTTGTSEAAGGGICILRGGPWPPIDVIEPRLPAECSDWFEAIRLRTATSGGVGTSSDGGGAKAAAVGFEAWALTRCVWTCVEIKILRCVLLDGVAMPAPRRSSVIAEKDLVHPTHWLISTQLAARRRAVRRHAQGPLRRVLRRREARRHW